MPAKQFKFFMLTIPRDKFNPPPTLPAGMEFIKGQAECGVGGYEHWQIVVGFTKYVTLSKGKTFFDRAAHLEPTKSAAANDYVWKLETQIEGTQFSLGEPALKRNSKTDWAKIKELAVTGKVEDIPADIFIKHYGNLKRIEKDNAVNVNRGVQEVYFIYGPTGTGKSHLAHELLGEVYYDKQPSTKWWDGYSGQENVLVEEFRGEIGISHLLRWLDKYSCSVEVKGGQAQLKTKKWVFTSNLDITGCYPMLDADSRDALSRRITHVVHKTERYQ